MIISAFVCHYKSRRSILICTFNEDRVAYWPLADYNTILSGCCLLLRMLDWYWLGRWVNGGVILWYKRQSPTYCALTVQAEVFHTRKWMLSAPAKLFQQDMQIRCWAELDSVFRSLVSAKANRQSSKTFEKWPNLIKPAYVTFAHQNNQYFSRITLSVLPLERLSLRDVVSGPYLLLRILRWDRLSVPLKCRSNRPLARLITHPAANSSTCAFDLWLQRERLIWKLP